MLVLVDTSVWIDHLRVSKPALVELLDDDKVFCHPWVRGELALGSLKDGANFLEMLSLLPTLQVIPHDEVMTFVERQALFSRGIGWVDAQLLTACALWPCRLWTKDARLAQIAQELRVGYDGHTPPVVA